MAILKREDLMSKITEKFGDDTSDETLALLTDIKDTVDEYESLAFGNVDYKKKYEENDAEWRKKYKDAFLNPPVVEDTPDDVDRPKPLTYENLFK